jgi:hypothetical protein
VSAVTILESVIWSVRSAGHRAVALASAVVLVAAALVALLPPPGAAALPAVVTYTYDVRGLGNSSDLEAFASLAADTLSDSRGWTLGGSIHFQRTNGASDFTLWLAAANEVPTFGPPCDSTYSCSIGRNVIINETRWLQSSPSVIAGGGSLRDYRNMVVNHEVGHWLGFGHQLCAGPGQVAAVMQQQSIDLQGCRFNPWPLPSERSTLAARRGVPIRTGIVGSLDLVSTVPGGSLHAAGWALEEGDTGSVTLTVTVGAAALGSVTADAPRPDVAAAHPSSGALHGFDAVLPLGSAPAGVQPVCFHARSASGLHTDLGCRTVTVADPFGSVDGVVPGPDGHVRVAGWAVDPDVSGPVEVHVYVDGRGWAIAPANVERSDVAAAFPGYGSAHGFDVSLAGIAGGDHVVCVYAINVGAGGNTALGCPTLHQGGSPFGSVDAVVPGPDGQVRVAGWAVDPDVSGPVEVHVYVDGRGWAIASAAGQRADVGAAFAGYGSAHGFDVSFAGVAGGDHVVCVYAINVGAGTTTTLGCPTLHQGGSPVGSVDAVVPGPDGQLRVAGWALDPDVSGPADVHVYVDGRGWAIASAAGDRADIGAAFPGYGSAHGFDVPLAGIAGGTHVVCVYAINVGAGGNTTLGCPLVHEPA